MATVHTYGDSAAWLIAETPSEAAAEVDRARREGELALLTLANAASEWNARPVYIDPDGIAAISPPVDAE